MNWLEGHWTWVVETHLAFLSSFGCDKYNTIGTTRTIDSCRWGILKNVNCLDITWIDGFDTTWTQWHTINYIERRIGGIERTVTTNADVTDTSRTLGRSNIYTGSLTLKCLKGIVYRLCIEFLFSNTCQRSRHVALALNTITYYHYFIQSLGVFEKHYLDWWASHLNPLSQIANVGNFESSATLYVSKFEVTIKIGNRTCVRSNDFHTCTDDWFAVVVNDQTIYGSCLLHLVCVSLCIHCCEWRKSKCRAEQCHWQSSASHKLSFVHCCSI